MTVTTTARNATLEDLATILRDQQGRKLDVVAPAAAVRSEAGVLVVEGTEPDIGPDGVTMTSGRYRPTAVCDEGIADKLNVPVRYLKRMREERPDLYDANVNGWLHGGALTDVNLDPVVQYPGDTRNFLVRCFRGDNDAEGVARAWLSDGYKRIDNFDVLTAALAGAQQAGAEVQIDGCDLSERRMSVKLVAPTISALAPELLRHYRSPFDQGARRAGWDGIERIRDVAAREGSGYEPGTEPVVWAGVVVSNSETGGGAFTITPRMVVKVCKNGLTITADAIREVHLGGRMEHGIVEWSEDTQQRNLELVTAQARDAMSTYLNAEYVTAKLADIEAKAGRVVEHPERTVKLVGSQLRMSQDTIDAVLGHFILGGQMTAGGVVNAMTSVAQTVEDPDEAAELEGLALRALDLVPA